MNKSKLDYLLFALLACFWSGSFIAIKVAVNVMPPLFSAMLRVAFALFFLILIFYVGKKNTQVNFAVRWKIWIVGLFAQGFPFFFLFWGERSISPGLAGILNGTVPIWAFLLCILCVKKHELFSVTKISGLLLGIIGVSIIFYPMLTTSPAHMNLPGAISVLLMAISYAIGALLNQQLFKRNIKIDFYANIYHQHWASLVFLLCASALLESWPSLHTLSNYSIWLASIYMGLFSTALGWLIYYYLIREWDAVRASAVMYIVPIMAVIWDYLFFQTRPRLTEIVGIIIILSGTVLIQWVRSATKLPKIQNTAANQCAVNEQ